MKLVLPYPISANRYWRTAVIPGAKFANTYVSKEAKDYKRDVRIAAYEQGCRKPIRGRVRVAIELYPNRPQDWEKRARRDPMNWDDDVQCIDLSNARKVLFDALIGIAYVDDRWVWEDPGKRMEPDGEGARVVVTIDPIVRQGPQPALFEKIDEANAAVADARFYP